MGRKDETYLGDGLYASWDGTYVWLRAPHLHHDQKVALDEYTLSAFERYIAQVRRTLNPTGSE